MINLESKQFFQEHFDNDNVQYYIPASVDFDFVVGYLVSSDGTSLASINWLHQYRQIALESLAPKEDLIGNSFQFVSRSYNNGSPHDCVQPAIGTYLYGLNNTIIYFSNTPLSIDTANNCFYNGSQWIVDNATVASSDFTKIATFDMSLQYVGDQITGANILLLAADAIS